jgi:hypothetical protein
MVQPRLREIGEQAVKTEKVPAMPSLEKIDEKASTQTARPCLEVDEKALTKTAMQKPCLRRVDEQAVEKTRSARPCLGIDEKALAKTASATQEQGTRRTNKNRSPGTRESRTCCAREGPRAEEEIAGRQEES